MDIKSLFAKTKDFFLRRKLSKESYSFDSVYHTAGLENLKYKSVERFIKKVSDKENFTLEEVNNFIEFAYTPKDCIKSNFLKLNENFIKEAIFKPINFTLIRDDSEEIVGSRMIFEEIGYGVELRVDVEVSEIKDIFVPSNPSEGKEHAV